MSARMSQRLGRGLWIPKRLVEARVGAVVKSVAPMARLWASTYRPSDGIGVPVGRGLFLLQCSPAEDRVRGISTKVSRAMLAAYLEDPNLASWGKQVLFVLLGHSSNTPIAETPPEPLLWAVAVPDLVQVVNDQGRGTIGSEALRELIGTGLAEELHSFVHQATRRQDWPSPRTPIAEGRRFWGGDGFGFNKPSPLGIAVDGLTEVSSALHMAL